MGQCIGYGKYKGCCPNCTTESGSLIFCASCEKLRTVALEQRKNLQEEAEKKTEKMINERT